METINLLRIELAEEVATLPEALRSSYPDLAVDFYYTVFKEITSNPITRLPASALEEALAATEAAAPTPPPFPSEERLQAAKAFTDAIEADAAELAKQSALSTDAFASLLAHREPASGDSCEGSLSGLVKCRRCSKVMFASVKAHHATLCKIRQAVVAQAGALRAGGPVAAAAQPSDSDNGFYDYNNGGGNKGKKRKEQPYDSRFPPPTSKSRLSRDSGGGTAAQAQHEQQYACPPINTNTRDYDQHDYRYQYEPPLSPMLAAAAAVRQGRSAPSRERRRKLAYLPNQDLDEPLILNRSPVRGGGGGRTEGGVAVATATAAERRVQRHGSSPIPLRLASQNSEELKNRTGRGPPVVVAVAALPDQAVQQQQQQQQQQQGAPRLLSAQQAQQVYQHIQQMNAMQAGGGNGGAPAADGKAPHILPTMPGTLVYRNGTLEMQQSFPNAINAGAPNAPASSGIQQQQQQQHRYIALPPQISHQFAAQLQYAQHMRQQQQQQQAAAGGRGPGAPVLQGGGGGNGNGGGGGGTFIPINGMHQAFNPVNAAAPATAAVPAAMYHQFVPSSLGFVPVQNPTVPQ